MRELTASLLRWHATDTPYAVATIVEVTGSAPRPAGATLAVDAAGTVVGSISGGCVEAAAYDLCRQVLRSGTPMRASFGYSDSDTFAIGLTCGGTIDVFVHRVSRVDQPIVEAALRPPSSVALVRDLDSGAMTAVDPHRTVGAFLDDAAVAEVRAMLDIGATGVRRIGCDTGESTIFVESFAPPPRMIVCGATDFAAAVCQVGSLLGYRVTLCDARAVFATRDRFPDADEIVVRWPHRYLADTPTDARTVVCVLTHDPKFDIPLLEIALRLPIAYVGAMGSRRADADRRTRLRAAGVTDTELARLHSPIGLDLGGRTAAEAAVAIGAEIVAVRCGGSTRPLHATDQPIHPTTGPGRGRPNTSRFDLESVPSSQ
ncbi:XdhC family protein [Nocardia sp. NPDC052112]|uniref:XdhC family protein n=1 Tax=Nocardia sp. NPDC052112 TaxID=3155646 RepID=UPI003441C9B3